MKKARVLSGIQPSGHLHLGNYFGMMKRMIGYQHTNELFCFLVNYHALTSTTDASRLRKHTVEAASDFIALGLDPEKAVFWVQSDVPEVTELTWLLSSVTNVGMLERAHSYKDKIAKGVTPNHGLFSYPVLMAADILLFGGELVPVGKDQKQHLEMSRDIAIKFNATYGDTFVVPESKIEKDWGVIPGIDGQKMSKSYRNTIDIFCNKDDLAEKVMRIVTDTTPIDEPKDPGTSTLYKIYSLFLDGPGKEKLTRRFEGKGLKYQQLKVELIDVIWEYFASYRETRTVLADDRAYVLKVLREGAEKARAVATSYLEKARKNVGLLYWE
ncbi:MAG: tryptophan--tRNA ligase [Candidatus Neomarinimicrobiota bacterium]